LLRQQVLHLPVVGDGEQGGVAEAGLGHHAAQVLGNGGQGVLVDAVEHHDHLDVAPGRVVEEIPHQLVGVAGGGGDEDPQVGGGQQLGGEGAVAVVDGVEVGGVEKR